MIIVSPLFPVPFPFPGIFTGLTGGNPEMDGPVSVTFSSKKNIQETRTVGGYTFSHFGDEPDRLTAKGSVILVPGREGLGFLSLLILKSLYRLDKKKIDKIQSSVKNAIATGAFAASAIGELYSQRLAFTSVASATASTVQSVMAGGSLVLAYKNMQQWMKENPDLSTTYIYHDNYVYRGFFNSFTYSRDANNPRFINYSFNFTIDWSTENYLCDKLLKMTEGKTITSLG
jgi:hypothetical protein